MRYVTCQRCLLAGAQLAGKIEDGVGFGQCVALFKCLQDVCRQAAGSGTDFQQVGSAQRHHLSRLRRQRMTEGRRYFRGGDEVTGGTEFQRPAGVIAHSRSIERTGHEVIEGDPAAGLPDFKGEALDQRIAEDPGVGRWRRKVHGGFRSVVKGGVNGL